VIGQSLRTCDDENVFARGATCDDAMLANGCEQSRAVGKMLVYYRYRRDMYLLLIPPNKVVTLSSSALFQSQCKLFGLGLTTASRAYVRRLALH